MMPSKSGARSEEEEDVDEHEQAMLMSHAPPAFAAVARQALEFAPGQRRGVVPDRTSITATRSVQEKQGSMLPMMMGKSANWLLSSISGTACRFG